jgi:plasmid stabilization system protein ParE
VIVSRLVGRPAADADVEATFGWYEGQAPGLGQKFLNELSATYDRIRLGPEKYQRVATEVRRAMARRFPYAVYFGIEGDEVVVLAVLHAARDPVECQRRA